MKLSEEILNKIKNNDMPGFKCQRGRVNGLDAYLINPKKDNSVVYTRDNIIFRSSIFSEDGELLSAGFKRFPNFGETPDVFPPPTDIINHTAVEKKDGSLIICDIINGKLNVRTRGTFSHIGGEFEEEIEQVMPQIGAWMSMYSYLDRFSHLFEFYSRATKIVLDYGPNPELTLIGVIDKKDYTLTSQKELDQWQGEYMAYVDHKKMPIKRPQTHEFDNPSSLVEQVKGWVGAEGVCLYSPCGQNIFKIKGLDYLRKHAYKSEINLKNVYGLIQTNKFKNLIETLDYIEREYDYECREESHPFVEQVFAAENYVYNLYGQISFFIFGIAGHGGISHLPRKEVAQKILTEYKNHARFAFGILDGKAPVNGELWNKQVKNKLEI